MHSDDVLLVDADPCALGLMAQGLTRQGLRVRPVARSEDALASLSREIPSLVISDVEPSGADGLRILEVMRRDPRTAEIPVLLLAKGEWTRRQEEAKQLGAQGLLKKPLFVQDVAVLGRLHAGHAAAEETFTGELGDIRCPWLVRGLLAGGRSGQLSFDPAGGRVYFRDGCVIDAVLPPLSGERALWRILTFEQGRYRVRFGPTERPQTVAIDLRDLQSRGFDHVRKWNELKDALGPIDAKLEVDYRRLSEQLDAVPPAVWPLLRLFDGHRTVTQALDGFGVDDHVAAQAIVKLQTLGLLRPAGSGPQTAPPPLVLTEVIEPPAPAQPLESGEVTAASEEAPSAAQSTDSAIESFFVGEAHPDTLEAAAAVQAAPVEAPTLGDVAPALVPEGVALALGHEPAEPPREAAPAGAVDSLESSFFGAEAAPAETAWTVEASAKPARKIELSPERSRWILGGLAAAGAAALVIALWPHAAPAPKPAPVPPRARAVVAPPAHPAVFAAAPVSPAPTGDAEATKLLEAGQKAYDAHQFAAAETSFQKAVAAHPDHAIAQMYLGLVEYEQGKLAEAIAPLEKARSLDPQNQRAKLLLGADYQELGKKDLARERYEEYLKLSPKGEYAREVHAILARLTKS
ncbi:MAG TPA: response regulator [Myxococcales bacterium]|nr:response regulator [Myxococcales bacterium]